MIIYYIINLGSVLFKDHKLSPELVSIDADTVNGQCFVMENNSKNKVACLAKERELWARAFTKVYLDNISLQIVKLINK